MITDLKIPRELRDQQVKPDVYYTVRDTAQAKQATREGAILGGPGQDLRRSRSWPGWHSSRRGIPPATLPR